MRVPLWWDFHVNTLLGTPVGHVINIHDNIMYNCIYKAEVGETEEAKTDEGDTHAEVHANNTIKVTKEQLSDEQRRQLAKAVENLKTNAS